MYIKNKLIDQIVNNIWFERNLICMLRTWETWNSTVRLSKFTPKKEIYEKFKEFFSKLVWRETLFYEEWFNIFIIIVVAAYLYLFFGCEI